MFIVSMVLMMSGLGTILYESKVGIHNDVAWATGVMLLALSLPFLIAGIFSNRRVHSDSHHMLP